MADFLTLSVVFAKNRLELTSPVEMAVFGSMTEQKSRQDYYFFGILVAPTYYVPTSAKKTCDTLPSISINP